MCRGEGAAILKAMQKKKKKGKQESKIVFGLLVFGKLRKKMIVIDIIQPDFRVLLTGAT